MATRRFPDAAFGFAIYPDNPAGVFRIVLRQPGEVRKTGGSTVAWVDQYSGEVLAVRDPKEFGAGNAFINWQFPLHNGEAFGILGRVAAFIGGLIPLLLYVTGFLLWWRKRRAGTRCVAGAGDQEQREASRTSGRVRSKSPYDQGLIGDLISV